MNDSFPVVLGVTSVLLFVVLYVWWALALSALFRKAGEAPWKGWVPIYNQMVILQLGGFSPWMILIALVPVFGGIAYTVVHIMACFRINKEFGHGAGLTVVAALFPMIWASILGFGSARWIGAAEAGPVRSAPSSVLFPDAPDLTPSVRPATLENTPSGARVSIPSPSVPTDWAPAPTAAPASSPPVPAPSSPALSGAPAAPAFPVPGSAFPPPPPPPPAPRSTPVPTGYDALDDDLADSAVDPEDRVPAGPSRTGSFLPPAAPPTSAAPAASTSVGEPIASVPGIRPHTPAPAADAPVTGVPAPQTPPAAAEPWAPSAPPAAAPAAERATTRPETRDDVFPELSEAVSAVAGAPDAGSPRSARSSVSALYARPEIPAEGEAAPTAAPAVGGAAASVAFAAPAERAGERPAAPPADDADDLDEMDRTVIARRRRIPWVLIPPGSGPVDLSSDVVILGRRPSADPAYPGAQLVPISDDTRTVSKTHARLELRGDTWFVTDLGSTNGVLFATLMGTEVEAQPGQEIEAGERFFLGDAEVRLSRSEG